MSIGACALAGAIGEIGNGWTLREILFAWGLSMIVYWC